jgi:glycosyltransferase involved in cell wall biosynthesis
MEAGVPELRDDRLRILLIGPLPATLGGTAVSFRALVETLERHGGVSVDVVDSSGIRGRGPVGAIRLARLLWRLVTTVGRVDVVALNVATTGLDALGAPVAALAAIARKPLIIRKFGGTDLSSFGRSRRAMMVWTLRRARLYLAQTKALVKSAEAIGLRCVRWYANSRPMPPLPDEPSGERVCRRFVYLGQVRREKGIRELIAAGERLSGSVVVDVLGTLGYDVPGSAFDGLSRVRYRGAVEPGEVHDVLARYDALVLPSYKEGYPGVVLEAYGAGLPVVTTRREPLPELVDDTSGILVEPRDADALHAAMKRLIDDAELYARLRRGVRARRGEFSDAIWHERFVEFCREAAFKERTSVERQGVSGAGENPHG